MSLPPYFCAPSRDVDTLSRVGWSRQPLRSLFPACLVLASLCAACGAVGSGPASVQVASVNVQPNSAQVFLGGKAHFSAAVQNASNSGVTWAVQEASGTIPDVGSIDASGNYVAPSALPAPATVTVMATLQSDPTVTGSAVVSIRSALAVSPVRAGVTTTQPLAFKVTTLGIVSADVMWSVDGVAGGNSDVGEVSASASGAIYTPPPTAGVHTVTASLTANPNVTGEASVYVTDLAGTFTWRNDNARSGVNSHELLLSPATVIPSTFGKLFSCPVDGYVYAQPLYVANLPIPGNGTHNVVFVATENDSVYAFDADASPCTALWPQPTSLTGGQQPIFAGNLVPNPSSSIGPLIGITGTPVIDPDTSTLYVMASIQETSNIFLHELYAVDLATGETKIRPSGVAPQSQAGRPPSFIPTFENQRAALLLDNGGIYVAFGSYDVASDYLGWLFEFDSGLQGVSDYFSATLDPPGGGIWQSGGGPSADTSHNVFVSTGDGPPNSGVSYSDSVVRLATVGGLSVADFFTPCDQGMDWPATNSLLESQSTAPLLLPDSAGSPSQPHLLISGTKEGILYVINRDAMGEFPAVHCSDSARAQAIDVGGPIFSTPLYWNNFVYVAPGQKTPSQNNYLMSLPMSQGILSPLPPNAQSRETVGPQGATPVVSANGASNAVLWLIDTRGAFATPDNDGPAILRAYDPNDLSKELYDSAQAVNQRDMAGPAVKFTVPTVANGKVYVGTQTELDVYGLLP